MIIKALWQMRKLEVFSIVLFHFIAALLGLALIALVHQTLFEPRLSLPHAGISYLILLPLLFVIGVSSYRQLSKLGAQVLSKLRMDLSAKVLTMDYQEQQAMGGNRIHNLLTQDLVILGDAFRALPLLAFNGALLLCSMLYLWWLSGVFFAFYLGILALAFVTAALLTKRSAKLMKNLTDSEQLLNQQFAVMINGAKELNLNPVRSCHFFENNLKSACNSLQQDTLSAEKHTSVMLNWITILIFVVLGFLLLISGTSLTPDAATLSGFVLMTLFIRGPIVSIASYMPALIKGNMVWRQLSSLGFCDSFNTPTSEQQKLQLDKVNKRPNPYFQQLELRQVTYQYANDADQAGFILGPINFTLKRGEINFIYGGNGSGKSTLAKVLTGLYPSSDGKILINGQIIEHNKRLNTLFSSVFFDFQLFDHIIDEQGNNTDDTIINNWLERLEMHHKVLAKNAKLTTTALSQGQRKRLALMVAACEQRPILLFDEWAADQDPYFKRIFYHQLLPYLQSIGKTIVAITHDENYFYCADKLYRLNQGKLERLG